MDFIQVDYNQELSVLEAVVSKVKQPGDFYVAGAMEIPMPRIEVPGAGMLSFPVPRTQIESMARHAAKAPYGRGEETIVDTSVRNVWQIAPGAVKISGKSWAASFQSLLAQVTSGLGCGGAEVDAEFYKLLIYERGGFFLAHRDSEKAAGMFGTLVVTLPSEYRGGALRIRHGEREVTVETSVSEPSEIAFAAFYADCEHEALPVSEGNRVCLVYNLVQRRTKGKQQALTAPDHGKEVLKAAAILDAYWKKPGAPAKLVWLLEHQYTPGGLSFASLKGADAARCQLLVQASRATCAAHLGIVHIGETGGAEEDFGFYGKPRRGRYEAYRDYDDDDPDAGDEGADDDGEDFEDFTAISVDGQWRYLDEWRNTGDCVETYGRIPVGDGELLPAGALDDEPPDQKRLTEASGNEGVTYERSYHRAALVLWPEKRAFDVLLQGGVAAALPRLQQLAAGGKTTQREALAAARRVIKAWPAAPDDFAWGGTFQIAYPGPAERIAMMSALTALNAPALLEQFIQKIVTPKYDGSENESLCQAVGVLGDQKAAAVLATLAGDRMPDRPNECVELLLALSANGTPSFQRTFQRIAKSAVAGLARIGVPAAGTDDVFLQWEEASGRRRPLAAAFITNLFGSLQRSNADSLCETVAKMVTLRPEVFLPATIVVPAIKELASQPEPLSPASARAVKQLWIDSAEFLLRRSAVPPAPPPDWRLDAPLHCKCEDCVELKAFARDPALRVHRFRVNKDRRRHLHQAIDGHRLDMTHVTERSGSPHTLVCTKDRRTYQARMKEYRVEVAAMGELLRLAPAFGFGALAARLEAAVSASSR